MISYVLAGGCFWCLDAVYRQLQGVSKVTSGYAGDGQPSPTYYQVASGQTRYAEAVQVSFDESIIPPKVILDIFFLIHDPTSLNQQGADVGPQYRSAMFFVDSQQKSEFETAIKRAQKNWDKPIVTTLEPLTNFFIAESEHQDYFNKQPASGYCSVVIYPKIIKARQAYSKWFKSVQ